jgi:hypothetical protein
MTNITELNTSKLNEMILRRDELLKENPQLKELQFKINDLMAGAGTQSNKNILLKKLMIESMRELQEKLNELENDLITLRKVCDK